ncbi:MAG: hypothetical protein EYC62_08450 [Alphaproteobacteria bacterium]|nr:MAG: hypothetical protein EYC62_08450 [Alphaproteobacteria bacterium]
MALKTLAELNLITNMAGELDIATKISDEAIIRSVVEAMRLSPIERWVVFDNVFRTADQIGTEAVAIPPEPVPSPEPAAQTEPVAQADTAATAEAATPESATTETAAPEATTPETPATLTAPAPLNDAGKKALSAMVAFLIAPNLVRQVRELKGAEVAGELAAAIVTDWRAKAEVIKKGTTPKEGATAPDRIRKRMGELRTILLKNELNNWTGIHALVALLRLPRQDGKPHLYKDDPAAIITVSNGILGIMQNAEASVYGPLRQAKDTVDRAKDAVTLAAKAKGDQAAANLEAKRSELTSAEQAEEALQKRLKPTTDLLETVATIAKTAAEGLIKQFGGSGKVPGEVFSEFQLGLAWQSIGQKAQERKLKAEKAALAAAAKTAAPAAGNGATAADGSTPVAAPASGNRVRFDLVKILTFGLAGGKGPKTKVGK